MLNDDGTVRIERSGVTGVVSLHAGCDDGWIRLKLAIDGDGYVAKQDGLRACLTLRPDGDDYHYTLTLEAAQPTRLQLKLSVPDAEQLFHLVPACLYGDNNLHGAEPGHFPNLTHEHPDNVSCAPYWEFRADRASLPLSVLCSEGVVAGVSIDPYSDCEPAACSSDEGFVRNGVFAELARDESGPACGVTLGYRNTPMSFINKDQWGEPTEHRLLRGTAGGHLFLRPSSSRLDAHDLVQSVYDDRRECPQAPIGHEEAARALTHAFMHVNWDEQHENFTNMHTVPDALKIELTAWRTTSEIGWSGGAVIGYPVLAAGHLLGDEQVMARARIMLDRVADATNPASGLLWDVCGPPDGKGLAGWWHGYLVRDVHCAYTNGSAVYYLLKSSVAAQRWGLDAPSRWVETATAVLDTVCTLQKDDGSFGYTYYPDRPEIADDVGFAGVWFVPALVLAYRITGRESYLDAAQRGLAYYATSVRALCCCGAPMDTWKSPDQEGNLGFLRGAQLLHETTGRDEYLELLDASARYEYLWRYGFRTRPEYPPLKGSHFSSCGGSVTSVSNPHIHPMGLYVSRELAYLAEQTGDAYHHARWEDGVNWSLNIVSLYPDVAGYGIPGVLTERYCPSDGLTIETFADGSPSSIWFAYNAWAAAAALEGLVELLDSYPGTGE
jgi:hypothetical protein